MFKGFSDSTFDFLIAISFNNNREFFHENHDWYMESVRRPLIELAAELSDTIESIDPALERRPKGWYRESTGICAFQKTNLPTATICG